jgi:hypothetical protein
VPLTQFPSPAYRNPLPILPQIQILCNRAATVLSQQWIDTKEIMALTVYKTPKIYILNLIRHTTRRHHGQTVSGFTAGSDT